jgi:hypothetical protein
LSFISVVTCAFSVFNVVHLVGIYQDCITLFKQLNIEFVTLPFFLFPILLIFMLIFINSIILLIFV